MKIVYFFYTVYAWFILFLIFLLQRLISPVVVFVTQNPANYYKSNTPLILFGYRMMGIRLEVRGRENIPLSRPFILASNHESNLDILSLIAATPVPVKFIAKRELVKTPLLGFCLKSQGHLLIDRSNARGALKEMNKIGELIQQGTAAMIFPEGTRSPNGLIQPFKRGIAKIAIGHSILIVPCRIRGAFRIMGKASFLMRPGVISVTYGPVMDPKDAADETVLVDGLYERISSL